MPIAEVTFTINQVIGFIIGLAGLLTAWGIIWAYITKAKSKVNDRFREMIREELTENNTRQEERIAVKLEEIKTSLSFDIRQVEKKLADYEKVDTKEKKELSVAVSILKDGLIEAYKKDFRDIYYKLRITGNIEDSEKAYLDKLFPKYVALGGNSDVKAKYEEICNVYQKRTQAKYDEVYNEGKKKRLSRKKLDDQIEEKPVEENKTVVES